MQLETKHDLNQHTITKLQKLIQANLDSRNGFRESAEKIDDPRVAALFTEMASQRSALASELQQLVEFNGSEAEDDGSVAAKMHRLWISLRSKVNGGDAHVILIEAERGEDYIKAAYEDVLKETAGSAVNDVLTRHYAEVKAGHDKVRDLRDAFAVKS